MASPLFEPVTADPHTDNLTTTPLGENDENRRKPVSHAVEIETINHFNLRIQVFHFA